MIGQNIMRKTEHICDKCGTAILNTDLAGAVHPLQDVRDLLPAYEGREIEMSIANPSETIGTAASHCSTAIPASVLDEEPPDPKKELESWYEWLERRHAYFAQEEERLEAEIGAELDTKYPPSEGWTGTGRQVRMRVRPELDQAVVQQPDHECCTCQSESEWSLQKGVAEMLGSTPTCMRCKKTIDIVTHRTAEVC